MAQYGGGVVGATINHYLLESFFDKPKFANACLLESTTWKWSKHRRHHLMLLVSCKAMFLSFGDYQQAMKNRFISSGCQLIEWA
mmetsp:Transcript_39513/g.67299  ORF Transcript_39513/g.67299 Transcript_39513/m.67299 type:complete len:84 (+) Transcript_39513:122-373(+)